MGLMKSAYPGGLTKCKLFMVKPYVCKIIEKKPFLYRKGNN